MNLLTPELLRRLQAEVIPRLRAGRVAEASDSIGQILAQLYDGIPTDKRISYGRVHTIKILSAEMFSRLDTTAGGAFQPPISGSCESWPRCFSRFSSKLTRSSCTSTCFLGNPLHCCNFILSISIERVDAYNRIHAGLLNILNMFN